MIPALRWLPAYDRTWLRGDFVAGITLAAYLLPAALGDASLANLPPEAGLYACLFSGLVFWLFCSSRHTAITVTSAISLLVGASLAEIAGGDATRFGALAAGTAVLVAVIALIAWAGASRRNCQLHLRKRHGRLQVRRGSLSRQHAIAETLRASRRAWRLLGEQPAISSRICTRPISLRSRSGLVALTVLILGKIFLKNKPVALFVVIGGIVASALLGLDAKRRQAPWRSASRPAGHRHSRCSLVRPQRAASARASPASCSLPSRRPPSAAPLPPSTAGASMPTRNSSLLPRRTSRRASAVASR